MNNRIVIFGGSFNPPTIAHQDIIEKLGERFNKVVVVPSKISPFKIGQRVESDENRLQMLSMITKTENICDFELKDEGVSYSYKTCEFVAKNNINAELFFAIGSEEVPFLNNWKNTDYFKNNITFFVILRPNFNLDSVEKARALGYKIELADFVGKSGSSSQLKVDVAFNKQSECVNGKVFDYIIRNNLYGEFKEYTSKFKFFCLSDERVNHVYRATKMGVLLAKRFGENVNKTITATILHDIGKNTSVARLKELNIPFNVDISGMNNAISHAPIGAAIAKYYFNAEEDVVNAIALHTTAGVNISLLSKIVFVADYIEEGRDFCGLEKIRSLCFRDIDLGVEAILKNTIDYLNQNKKSIYFTTENAFNYYHELNKCKTI